MFRIGIDTGGTNTDVVLTNVDDGRVYFTKHLPPQKSC